MKDMTQRITYLIVLFFCAFMSVNAQESGRVMVNINLHRVQIIKVNPIQSEVHLDYKQPDDYEDGVNSLQENHLTIFSTGAYEVFVSSDQPLSYIHENQQADIHNALMVRANNPNGGSGGILLNSVYIQQSKQSIISSDKGDFGISFDIEYHGMGGNAFLNLIDASKELTIKQTNLVYTIEVK
jgi:hypothetical protein